MMMRRLATRFLSRGRLISSSSLVLSRSRRNIVLVSSTIGLATATLSNNEKRLARTGNSSLESELKSIDENWESDMESAATALASLAAEYPNNPEILWRRARVAYNIGFAIEDTNAKKRRFEEAMDFCTEALRYGANISATHKWYAIVLSEISGLQGTKASIQSSYEVKEHFDRAAELDPSDPNCWHFLGRWSFTIASIGWWSRQAAAAIFATPPESSFEEALDFFEKAEAIRPGFWKANNLFIAKCHQSLGNTEKALEWLQKANSLPTNTAEDIQTQKEVSELLEKLSKK